MIKHLTVACFVLLAMSSADAQVSLTKIVGRNSQSFRMGYCPFSSFEFPLNSETNFKSIKLELMDLAFFPYKDEYGPFETPNGRGYLSIKAGYKNYFSETRTGFYLEPSAGYTRVVGTTDGLSDTYGDGFAAAIEGGYSLEVGQRGHAFNLGLKYETDRAGKDYTLSSVGVRLSYSFNAIGRKDYE